MYVIYFKNYNFFLSRLFFLIKKFFRVLNLNDLDLFISVYITKFPPPLIFRSQGLSDFLSFFF